MQKKPLSRYWLIIGVTALAIAGLYSLVLAGGRSPKLGDNTVLQRIFHESLVVHVDLSVLVWFLAIACMMWSLINRGSRQFIPYMEEAALWCFAIGTAAITLSPLDKGGEALMSNYIPVIHSPVFFVGLMLIFCGTGLMVTKILSSCGLRSSSAGSRAARDPAQSLCDSQDDGIINFAIQSAAIITLIALACFVWSRMIMPPIIDGQQYYDMLFWGGGHVLQFTHVQIVMVCWLLMAKALKPEFHVYKPHLKIIFSIGVISALISPVAYLLYDITSMEFRNFFTYLMILANGIAPSILALWILPGLINLRALRKGSQRALWSALIMSFVLFIYGGILGALIHGQNVVIPAHYHGSIVGLTMAFMGFAYFMLPKLGYADASATRLAYWQPYIYGVGQLMHVSGFAWSGGYGALRKTPGGTYEGWQQVAMGLMGGGAGLAAIGGLLFVIVVSRAMLNRETKPL